MLHELGPEDRLRLLRFVCAFAWTDLEVGEAERDFVERLVKALALTPSEAQAVQEWLTSPPRPEEIDPQDIPTEQRGLVLLAVAAVVSTDGKLTSREAESLKLLEQLLTGDDQTEEWEGPLETEELEKG